MTGKNSVLIIGRNPAVCDSLRADLEILGFNPLPGRYHDIDRKDILKKSPAVIIFEFTEYDHDVVSACDLLLKEGVLPSDAILIALVSEDTMGQIPLDYRFVDIIKFPCSRTELGFRIRRLINLRRQEPEEDTIYIGSLSLSQIRHEVRVDGRPVILRHKEYELLRHFITHPDHVFTRQALLTGVWGYDSLSDSRTVDVHIRRLRSKIGDTGSLCIQTVRGTGYVLRSRG